LKTWVFFEAIFHLYTECYAAVTPRIHYTRFPVTSP